ncbi:phage tail protein [Anaerocolumna sp. AGMB13020]|uniref:phage tail protein n=1 Tax=Anaerocolumna sp. AGMB13020 TaxID=3081750 RepID=UPI00295455F4|nr:phage tail protein [Anaerocolumna sp. AGMB13020]WOO34955.1 phage tail protein [Anaerocolumna sp. AGMB13020]
MSVGSYGGIVFQVSKKKIYSFSNFKRTRTAEWKEHSRHGQKAISQFISPGIENITLDIHLNASLGVKPLTVIEKWGKLLETGHHDIFVIGGKQVGKNEWKIESVSEAWNTFLSKGELIAADITVTLSEYITSDKPKKKSTSTTTKKTTTTNSASSALVIGKTYKVKKLLTGYYTAPEAKNQSAVNRTGKVYPGTYYIFNISQGMVNVTKVKGSPGSWINPSKNK